MGVWFGFPVQVLYFTLDLDLPKKEKRKKNILNTHRHKTTFTKGSYLETGTI